MKKVMFAVMGLVVLPVHAQFKYCEVTIEAAVESQEMLNQRCPGLQQGDVLLAGTRLVGRVCDVAKPIHQVSKVFSICHYVGEIRRDITQ